MALVLAMLPLGPATPARAGLSSGATNLCPAVTGLPAVTGHAIDYTGSLTCYRPGAPGFNSTVTRSPDLTRSNNPYQGEFCMNVYYYPVGFSEAAQGDIRASFSLNGGGASAVPLTPADAIQATTNDALVAEAQTGSYQLSNPSDPASPLICSLNPVYYRYCPGAGPPPPPSACYIWLTHAITPATTGGIPSIAPYMDGIVKSLHQDAGTIVSAPSQTGVVNAPVCFWIENMGIPAERDLVLTVAGPPDASRRQIYYTFLIRITFQDPVHWDFGDPHGNDQTQPLPACGQHPQLTAHRYTEISDDINPDPSDHRYHVTAQEQYSITAEVYWVDSNQSAPQPVPVDPGVTAPVISPPPYLQYVGQVEGIPVGG